MMTDQQRDSSTRHDETDGTSGFIVTSAAAVMAALGAAAVVGLQLPALVQALFTSM
jgi:hypothetical protein